MEYLHVASGTLIIFIIALVAGKKRRGLPDYVLLFWLLLFLVNVASFIIISAGNFPLNTFENLLLEFSEASIFLHGPFFWFYACSLTQPFFHITRRRAPHLFPFIICYVFLSAFVLLNIEPPAWCRQLLIVLKLVSLLIYVLAVIRQISQHQKNVSNIFSNPENKYLGWLSLLAWGILVLWGVAVLSLIAGWFTTIDIPQYGGVFVNVSASLFIFFMCYFGVRQPQIFLLVTETDAVNTENLAEGLSVNSILTGPIPPGPVEKSEKYQKSGLTPERAKELHGQLKELMKINKFYMDEELTLFGLAAKMEIHPNHLSQVINMYEHRNFFEFINYYRVEAVKESIISKQNKNKTLLGIAFDCGFSSKAAFNRAFKKFTGMAPSEFKKQQS